MTNKKKPTIGLLIDWAANSFGLRLWAGAADYAKEHDANLVCFVGGSINSPQMSEKLRNEIINFINPDNIDGLIVITSVISQFISDEEMVNFFNKFKSFPVVSVGRKIPDVPSIVIDNDTGMKKLMDHLINIHGYKNMAFIKGPEENFDTRERFRIFRESLKAAGLMFDPRLVFNGQYNTLSGRAAVDWFIDKQQLRPEVIVSANDEMAKGAIEALRERGILMPGEIAVVGFDDIESNQTMLPSITTVRLPLYEQGHKAAQMILEMTKGKKVESLCQFPTYIILRESCGCFIPRSFKTKVLHNQEIDLLINEMSKQISEKVAQIINDESGKDSSFDSEAIKRDCAKVTESYLKELLNNNEKIFFNAWYNFLTQIPGYENYYTLWMEILSIINEVTQSLVDGKLLENSKAIINEARNWLLETKSKWQYYIKIKQSNENIALQALGEELNGTITISEITDLLERSFPTLGIKSCYLALAYLGPQETKPSRLVMAFNEEGRLNLGHQGQEFPNTQLLPKNILPQKRYFSVMVDVLYQSQDQIGYIVFETDPTEGVIYENLARRLRSALKGTLLLEQVKNQALELQISNKSLHKEVYEKLKVEKELRESESRLKAIIEANPIPLTIYRERDGKLLFTNENFSKTFEISPDDVKEKHIQHFFTDKRELRNLQKMLEKSCFEEKAYIENHEVMMRKESGDSFWAVLSLQSLMFGGELAGILSFYDITERKRLEKEILSISEREQRRIAQDLHDGLGQLLTGISFMTRVLETELKKKSLPEAESAAEISRLIGQSLQFNKNIIRGLFPVELEENDLIHALQDLLAKTETQYDIKYKFHFQKNIFIQDKTKALHLYRIAQEAIFNIVKHAEADKIEVTFIIEKPEWVLIISDNGIGLSEKQKSATGMGLRIMQYRAHMIGGSIYYSSENHQGTKIVCRIPMKE